MKEDCRAFVGKPRGTVMKKEWMPTMHAAPSKRGIAYLLGQSRKGIKAES